MAFLPPVIDITRMVKAGEIALDIFLVTGLVSFLPHTRLAIVHCNGDIEF